MTSQKFEAKLSDFDNLDTKALDNFIKKQRAELVNSGLVGESALKENEATPKAVDFEAEKVEDTQETSQEVPVSEDVASEKRLNNSARKMLVLKYQMLIQQFQSQLQKLHQLWLLMTKTVKLLLLKRQMSNQLIKINV